MSEWRVTLTCRSSDAGEDVAGETMQAALGALKRLGAVGTTGERSYSLTLTTSAATSERAKVAALRALEKARAAGLPDWPVAGVEVLQVPGAVPTLVGIPEIAGMLGVHVERVRAIVRENETFPQPIGQLGVVKVWTEEAVAAWSDTWPRRSGRPPKAPAAAGASSSRRGDTIGAVS